MTIMDHLTALCEIRDLAEEMADSRESILHMQPSYKRAYHASGIKISEILILESARKAGFQLSPVVPEYNGT